VGAAAFSLRYRALRPTASSTSNGAPCPLVTTQRGRISSCAFSRIIRVSFSKSSMAKSTAPARRSSGRLECKAPVAKDATSRTSVILRAARRLETVRAPTAAVQVQRRHLPLHRQLRLQLQPQQRLLRLQPRRPLVHRLRLRDPLQQ
jgi:hypothetical protein